MEAKKNRSIHQLYILGTCLIALGVVFAAALQKTPSFSITGIFFIIAGTVLMIIGISRTKMSA